MRLSRGDGTEKSGVILMAGVSQKISDANNYRSGMFVQNQSADALFVRVGKEATQDHYSLRIPAGQLYEFPYAPEAAVYLVGPTQGQVFHAKEW